MQPQQSQLHVTLKSRKASLDLLTEQAQAREGQQWIIYTIISLATASYLLVMLLLYAGDGHDLELTAKYKAEVPRHVYVAPVLGFGTAFLLNLMTLMVERANIKFQMAFMVCYINLLAAICDWMSFREVAPVYKDAWGYPAHIGRTVMWLWTTPVMVYLLSLISDFSPRKMMVATASDTILISLLLLSMLVPSKILNVMLLLPAVFLFMFVMRTVWSMFDAPIATLDNGTAVRSLLLVRVFTLATWVSFPCLYFYFRLGLVSRATEELLWGVCDFLGKVIFSSSLLQSNFLTIRERRVQALRLVEEARQLQMIEELQELVEQKEQFLSGMSHELRTPLNGIIGLSDALLVGCCGSISEQARKTVFTIKSSGTRLLNLINDILDAASLRQGSLVVKHERVQLRKVADDIVDLMMPLVRQTVQLVNTVPRDLPPVLGDTGRILQILHNLVGNACKFTHKGHITVGAVLKDDQVELYVQDTGIGIPPDKLSSIFQAFQQVDMSTTRKYGGTGLGLTLVQELVLAHGGSIAVKSRPGAGSTFTVTFKVWDAVQHERHSLESQASSTGARQRLRNQPSLAGSHRSRFSYQHSAGTTSTTTAPRDTSSSDPSGKAGSSMQVTVTRGPVRPLPLPTKASQAYHQARNMLLRRAHSGLPTISGPDAASDSSKEDEVEEVNTQQQVAQEGVFEIDAKTELRARSRSKSGPDDSMSSGRHEGATPLVNGAIAEVAGADGSEDQQLSLSVGSQKQAQQKDRPVHLLSVDDDPINQMVIENLLAPEGFQITKAMDGQTALAMIEEMPRLPDIILLDVMMPGMSGYEVCRRLRELYPASCVPVIMVSAKSKEEDIVQGLVMGANDYVVKPFGRQEILARIHAHLRYRDTVMKAAVETLEDEEDGTDIMVSQVLSETWLELLGASSKQFSLPTSIKSMIENHSALAPLLQIQDDLTLVVIGINNMSSLAETIALPQLMGCLASLHIYVGELLEQYNAYMVDCIEDRLLIITGLSGERVSDQVNAALDLSRDLLQLADTMTPSSTSKVLLSVGIHTCTGTGVVVGVNHPVLHVTGALAEKAAQLQATCPSGCIHVSQAVFEASGRPAEFVTGIESHPVFEPTYLHCSGAWSAHQASMTLRFDRYVSEQPFGPLNGNARRLRPVQLALISIIHCDPGLLVELVTHDRGMRHHHSVSTDHVRLPLPPSSSLTLQEASALAEGPQTLRTIQDWPRASGTQDVQVVRSSARSTPVPRVAAGEAAPGAAGLQLVTKLQLEKESMQKTMEEKQNEIDKLQVQIDNLRLDLYGRESLQTQLDAAKREVNELRDAMGQLRNQLPLTQVLRSPSTAPLQQSTLRRRTTSAVTSAVTTATSKPVVMSFKASTTPSSSHSQVTRDGKSSVISVSRLASDAGVSARLHQEAPASILNIEELLTSVNLGHLVSTFEQEEVTADMIPYLDDAALLELGVRLVGERVRLRRAAQQLA